jgi:uncharacterized repeat protein (TIGR03833 family)
VVKSQIAAYANHTTIFNKTGMDVAVVLKEDQRSGELTEGTVQAILTNSSFHPHGIKVKLEDGQVGRVQEIMNDDL